MQCCEVKTLVEDAFFGTAISKEDHRNSALALALQSEGITHSDRNGRAHHSGCAENVVSRIDQMHRSAFASRAAGAFPVKLGHHPSEVPAFGEISGMTAIRRGNNVVRAQRVAYANRDGFLADGKVHGAFDFIGRINSRNFFFNLSNELKLLIDALEIGIHRQYHTSRQNWK